MQCFLEPHRQHYIRFFLCKVVPEIIILGQYCTDKNPLQCCPWGSRQQCTGKILFKAVLILLNKAAQIKTLRNVVRETPDNNGHEKFYAMLSNTPWGPWDYRQ